MKTKTEIFDWWGKLTDNQRQSCKIKHYLRSGGGTRYMVMGGRTMFRASRRIKDWFDMDFCDMWAVNVHEFVNLRLKP